jgi:hypothetical protein
LAKKKGTFKLNWLRGPWLAVVVKATGRKAMPCFGSVRLKTKQQNVKITSNVIYVQT